MGITLVVFFLASVIHQFRFSWWQRISNLDRLILLPRWTFFAPNPGRHAFHLVYRDFTLDQPGGWKELVVSDDDLSWRWFWHPARYPSKGLNDLFNFLFQSVQSYPEDPQLVMLSTPYISLLKLVMTQPGISSECSQRQFAVVATRGFQEDRILEIRYISGVHRVEP